MPKRPGITLEKIVDASLELLQSEGEQALTLAALAKHLGIKAPSLYNHVTSAADLQRALRLRGLTALHRALQTAAVGRAGSDALTAVCHAYRTFAQAQPALYRLTLAATEHDDEALQAAGAACLDVILATLRAYPLEGDEALHATRCLRSSLHGFVSLEIIESGFAMPLDLDTSFEHLVRQLDKMLREWSASEVGAANPRATLRP